MSSIVDSSDHWTWLMESSYHHVIVHLSYPQTSAHSPTFFLFCGITSTVSESYDAILQGLQISSFIVLITNHFISPSYSFFLKVHHETETYTSLRFFRIKETLTVFPWNTNPKTLIYQDNYRELFDAEFFSG